MSQFIELFTENTELRGLTGNYYIKEEKPLIGLIRAVVMVEEYMLRTEGVSNVYGYRYRLATVPEAISVINCNNKGEDL